MSKTIYRFHPNTRHYIGTSEAVQSPIDGAWMIPGDATEVPPPDVPAGKVAVYTTNRWALVPAESVPESRN